MKREKLVVPIMAIITASCVTQRNLDRVRISQPNLNNKIDTSFESPKIIKWTDESGQTRIVTQAAVDSTTGENISLTELSEITVTARSKQTAERNGKIDLSFVVTVPGSLINNKWQLQLTVAARRFAATSAFHR